MKRVLHYAAAPVAGGLVGQVALLAPRTADRGWISQVILSPAPALDATASGMARAGVEVARLTVAGKGDLRGLLALRGALRRAHPSILHVHLASPVESLPVLLAAPFLCGARLVTTEHAPSHHPAERPWSRAIKRLAGRRVARVIALSSADAAYLGTRFHVPAARIAGIGNGVVLPAAAPSRDAARRRLGVDLGARVVGYVGEIAEKKGLGDLLEAIAGILKAAAPRSRDLIVLAAGEGPFAETLRVRAERAGAGNVFRLIGALRPADDLYAACDLFVLPSHGEAMPLALLEAMAAGRAVLATRVGGIPEAVRDGVEGALVPARDPAALAAALVRLLGDPAALERMGEAARSRAEAAFDVSRMVERTCSLYDEILEGRPA